MPHYHIFDSTVSIKNIISGGADHREYKSGIFNEEDAEFENYSDVMNSHLCSPQYLVNYHLIVINEFHLWGHTAIGQDKCSLFGNHPTMNKAPFDLGGSHH